MSEEMDPRIEAQIKEIIREKWGTTDHTLDELASQVKSIFGVDQNFINVAVACFLGAGKEALERGEKHELSELMAKTLLSGMILGSIWQRLDRTIKRDIDG